MRQLFDNEDILLDEIQQKEVLPNIPKTRARSILEAFEYIVELAKLIRDAVLLRYCDFRRRLMCW